MNLSEFNLPLERIDEPADDIGTTRFANKDKSIILSVINGMVTRINLLPKSEDRILYSYVCSGTSNSKRIRNLVVWLNRYWRLSSEAESKVLEDVARVFIETPDYNRLYLAFYYRCPRDKEVALQQAKRAKTKLESYGLNPNQVIIVDGGKKNKSELVLFPAYERIDDLK